MMEEASGHMLRMLGMRRKQPPRSREDPECSCTLADGTTVRGGETYCVFNRRIVASG